MMHRTINIKNWGDVGKTSFTNINVGDNGNETAFTNTNWNDKKKWWFVKKNWGTAGKKQFNTRDWKQHMNYGGWTVVVTGIKQYCHAHLFCTSNLGLIHLFKLMFPITILHSVNTDANKLL